MQTVIRITLFMTILGVAFTPYSAGAPQSGAVAQSDQNMSGITIQIPRAEIEKRIVDKHPAAYLLYAGQLWAAGRKDESVFWLYVGQLRYRFHLASSPGIDPSGDPALFASLLDTIGSPINLYAGGDPVKWAGQIDEALRWDADHTNGFTSKAEHPKELAEVRAGLIDLRDFTLKNKEELKAQREQKGIGTIGVVDGVYVEERNEKMPKDWPALVSPISLEKLSGVYTARGDAVLGPTFFFDDTTRNARSLSDVELSPAGDETLLVVGRRNGLELLRKTIVLHVTSDAAVFEYSRSAEQAGLADGSKKDKVTLYQNSAGELVIARMIVTEGHYPNKPMPVRLTYTFWNRAPRLH